ncbi:AraC family transcriptional regulator [Paenibacillus sp. MBLB4367]|uniref:AraC family transcriptional regulator n=1 Tax=Paenibacillus sp. MBLB4367 TaxID=3384767 RepID=UPI0039081DFE
MMPFLLAEFANMENTLPLYVCCVGSHEQKHLVRKNGYPAHQLFLSRSGRGTFRIEGRRDLVLMPGTVLILPASVPHSYFPDWPDDVWDLGFVAFQGKAALPMLEQISHLLMRALETPNFAVLWDQLEALWHLISLNGEKAYWGASKRLYDLMLTLLEGQATSKPVPKSVFPAGQPHPALQAAIKLIHDHFNERLLLSNVARAVGYSVQHFRRLFVDYYRMTPQQYILQLRMRWSTQLLQEDPGIAVETVAQQIGMDTSYFIRMFKLTYGKTPKQYRKSKHSHS